MGVDLPIFMVFHTYNVILDFNEFVSDELNAAFADPNHGVTARRLLATIKQGDNSVEELIQKFQIHGPTLCLGDIGLIDHFEQALHPLLVRKHLSLETYAIDLARVEAGGFPT